VSDLLMEKISTVATYLNILLPPLVYGEHAKITGRAKGYLREHGNATYYDCYQSLLILKGGAYWKKHTLFIGIRPVMDSACVCKAVIYDPMRDNLKRIINSTPESDCYEQSLLGNHFLLDLDWDYPTLEEKIRHALQ
jgi:hypothetical protein